MEKELTSFQKKRLENIKRNNDLLKKLNLSKLGNSDQPATTPAHQKKKKATSERKVKKKPNIKSAPALPTRRSRRLRGEEAPENKDASKLLDASLEPVKREFEDIKILGDIKLSDIIKDEERLDKLQNMKVSSGDFFNELRELRKHVKTEEDNIDVFDNLRYVSSKVTYERISALYVHPGKESAVIVGGDVSGNIGIWNADTEQDEIEQDNVTRFQLFGKNVGRIDCFPSKMEKLICGSYDGFLRSMDLNNLESEEILQLKNEYDDPLGVSDCQFSYEDPNLLYLTTLSGEFTTVDVREGKAAKSVQLRRLADKKIGSMSINPQKPYQIATGSLDRTLRLWDIRKIVDKPEWSNYEDFQSHEIVASYDSRLSVSAVSYSPNDGTLVCNGYDDTIRLFDVNDNVLTTDELKPKLTLRHNCQTGRWTSILKARFKPNKNIFAIANMSRAIDIYTSSGEQLAHLPTPTVPAVINWHPSHDWIAGGNSSGKVFLFTTPREEDTDVRVKKEDKTV